MRILVLYLLLVVGILHAETCQELFDKAQIENTKVQALIKSDVPSFKAYELLNGFIDLSSLEIAECSLSDELAFRYKKELTTNMQKAAEVREKFKVQTYEELKKEAMLQAKKEAQCVNVYNNQYIIKDKQKRKETEEKEKDKDEVHTIQIRK